MGCGPMWAALRSRALSLSSTRQGKLGFPGLNRTLCSSLVDNNDDVAVAVADRGLLKLDEVQKILTDVKADNISVVPVGNQCEWTDFMVLATGRSAWHVRNIAQALIYKVRLFTFLRTRSHIHTLSLGLQMQMSRAEI